MALADPQVLVINAISTSLNRTGLTLTEGQFSSQDGDTILTVGHSNGIRTRHVVKVTSTKIVADPLVPDTNVAVSYSAHVVFDKPRNGVTNEELSLLSDALKAWLTPSNIRKVVGRES